MSALRIDGPSRLRKQRANKLDPYTDELLKMEEEKKTTEEMVAWVQKQGGEASMMSVCRFLKKKRANAELDDFFERIARCASECGKIDAIFAEHPAPELEIIIKVFKVAIMNLAKEGLDKPSRLKLSDQLSRTAIGFMSSQDKWKFEERKVAIREQMAAEAKKRGQAKALEYCLIDAKAFPEVQELFQAAFAALKKAKAVA